MPESPSMVDLLKEHIDLARRLRVVQIHFDPERCKGVWQCYEVCPVGCWRPDRENRVVVFEHAERCIACGACVLQCPEKAIELKVPDE
jgi:NAD-dependent dihydropyrimidine dehydrogenase PreA subunit